MKAQPKVAVNIKYNREKKRAREAGGIILRGDTFVKHECTSDKIRMFQKNNDCGVKNEKNPRLRGFLRSRRRASGGGGGTGTRDLDGGGRSGEPEENESLARRIRRAYWS